MSVVYDELSVDGLLAMRELLAVLRELSLETNEFIIVSLTVSKANSLE